MSPFRINFKPYGLIVITIVLLLFFQIFPTQSSMKNQSDPSPYAANLIAHAGGVIDGYLGTNSLEALKESARLGYSIIEVDIMTTSDGKFVLNHDWNYAK